MGGPDTCGELPGLGYAEGKRDGAAEECKKWEKIVRNLASYVMSEWVPGKFDDPSGAAREEFSKRWKAIIAGEDEEYD